MADVFPGGAYRQLLAERVGLGTKRRLPEKTGGSEVNTHMTHMGTSASTGTGNLTPAPVGLGCWFVLVSLRPQPQHQRLREQEKEQQALWSCCYWDQTHCPWRISPKVSKTTFVQPCWNKVKSCFDGEERRKGSVEGTRWSSTSKTRVLLAGMRLGTPFAPYASWGGTMTSR